MAIYNYPDLSKPDNKTVVKLAARVGRSFGDENKHCQAIKKLRAFMETLCTGSLRYWKEVVMIDPRWCGATGTGAFWAVASRVVNEIANRILSKRSNEWKQLYGDTLFVVNADKNRNGASHDY